MKKKLMASILAAAMVVSIAVGCGKTEETADAGNADSKGNAYPNELTVTFEETHTIHAIRVALNPQNIWGKRTQTFAVLIMDENGEQQTLIPESAYEFDPDRGNEVILEFETAAVTSVTLEFTANTGASGGQVAEFEIFE